MNAVFSLIAGFMAMGCAFQALADDDEDRPWVADEKRSVAPDRRVLVDLNDNEQRALDSVGILTLTNYDWMGSAFFISKCHLLTSNHVVFNLYKNEKPSLGKAVKFGIRQQDEKPWKKFYVNARVVAFDEKAQILRDNGTVLDTLSKTDWALIKLDKSAPDYFMVETPAFCLPKSEIKIEDTQNMKIRAIGHPRDKFKQTGKIALWQDTNCKIIQKRDRRGTWYSTCQLRPGMSGGPVATYLPSSVTNSAACWMPVGINSKNNGNNGGFALSEETKVTFSNQITPFNEENLRRINEAMEKNPCD